MEDPKKSEQDLAKTMADLAAALKANALTPEIIQELRKPYIDPVRAESDRQQQRAMAQDERDTQARKKLEQENCTHKHPQKPEMFTVNLLHCGLVTREAVGLCTRCFKIILPCHVEIKWDPKDPKGKQVIVAEDSAYWIVRQLESQGANANFGVAI